MRLFTPCTCLKTKESYDRWITRRFWGFRQQISKAKYPKISVANIRKLQENTAALCKMAALPSGSCIPDVNIRVESAQQPGANGRSRMPNVGAHPGINGDSRIQMAARIQV